MSAFPPASPLSSGTPTELPAAEVPAGGAPAAEELAAGKPTAEAPAAEAPPTEAGLLDFVRRVAADTDLVASLPLDPEERTWLRLEGPGGSEAWLIGWPPGSGTGWHDHAESIGAFLTASGELTEHSLAARLPAEGWRTLELSDGVDRSRALPSGRGRAFGRHHVHDVLNESAGRHAVSVHAYYPPLPSIRRYSRSGQVLRLEQVEVPEDWQ
jgi:hypothetical protein